MRSKNTLSITEARKKIFGIAEEVQKPNNYYTLTDKGRPRAVIMSAEEFESWVETLEVMRDFPDLKKDVEKVERDIASGAYKKYATLEEIMAKYGFVTADSTSVPYGVHSPARKKSRKRSGKNARIL